MRGLAWMPLWIWRNPFTHAGQASSGRPHWILALGLARGSAKSHELALIAAGQAQLPQTRSRGPGVPAPCRAGGVRVAASGTGVGA